MGRKTTATGQRDGQLDVARFGRRFGQRISLFFGYLLVVVAVFAVSFVATSEALATDYVDSTRYIVGPGDEFTINFSEARIDPIRTIVGVEGAATIDGVGTYALNGLTLTAAKAKLLAGLKKRFAGSGIELSLTTVRTKRTLVAGAVANPGLYDTKASALVSDLIARAGGLSVGASRRNIEIRSTNGESRVSYPVDLEMFSLVGDPEANPAVYLGDVIYVPLFSDSTQRRYVSGEVRSPRWVEYTSRDNVMDLIGLAGGLTGDARRDSALFFDGSDTESSQTNMISLTETMPLPASSRIIVLTESEKVFKKDVSISGAVANPGMYPYEMGLTVEELVLKAGGTIADAYTDGITLFNNTNDHGALARALVNSETKSLAVANLSAPTGPISAFNVRSGADLNLAPGDSVVVPFAEGFVSVLGQVKVPGLVTFRAGRSAHDYISSAGGATSWADLKLSYVTRKTAGGATPLASAGEIYDGDIIFVARKTKSQGSGTLGWLRDITLIGAGVALTVLAIDEVGK